MKRIVRHAFLGVLAWNIFKPLLDNIRRDEEGASAISWVSSSWTKQQRSEMSEDCIISYKNLS